MVVCRAEGVVRAFSDQCAGNSRRIASTEICSIEAEIWQKCMLLQRRSSDAPTHSVGPGTAVDHTPAMCGASTRQCEPWDCSRSHSSHVRCPHQAVCAPPLCNVYTCAVLQSRGVLCVCEPTCEVAERIVWDIGSACSYLNLWRAIQSPPQPPTLNRNVHPHLHAAVGNSAATACIVAEAEVEFESR